MLNVKYGSGYGQSSLSVLSVLFVRISARILEAYGYGPDGAVPPETVGAVLLLSL